MALEGTSEQNIEETTDNATPAPVFEPDPAEKTVNKPKERRKRGEATPLVFGIQVSSGEGQTYMVIPDQEPATTVAAVREGIENMITLRADEVQQYVDELGEHFGEGESTASFVVLRVTHRWHVTQRVERRVEFKSVD